MVVNFFEVIENGEHVTVLLCMHMHMVSERDHKGVWQGIQGECEDDYVVDC